MIDVISANTEWNYNCRDGVHRLCRLEFYKAEDGEPFGIYLNSNNFENTKTIYVDTKENIIPSKMLTTFPKTELLVIVTKANHLTANLFDGGDKMKRLTITSDVETLRCEPFLPMPSLFSLILNSKINHIEDNAIKCIPNLMELQLSNNKLHTITKEMFFGAEHLRVLNLRNNAIENIEDDSFNLPDLKIVELGYNKLKTISSKLFTEPPGIVKIDLEGNLMDNIDFSLPNTLEVFICSHNPIKTNIDVVRFAFNFIDLKELVLKNTTSLIKFARAFDSIHNLTKIDLSYNNLTDNDVLRHLKLFPELKYILLSGNNFKEINENNDVFTIFTKLIQYRV